jgi:D-serine deaminase-like pyridoxal phosphate-dependent protein
VGKIRKNQIETPALLIDLDIYERNLKTMSDYFSPKKSKLRPHYKTHKCPAIAHQQIKRGAKGITCATLGEAETLIAAGIDDILIANQIVEQSKIYGLAGLARGDARISMAADNAENIRELSEAASAVGSTLYVLVEVNVGSNRCGVNTPSEALGLAQQIDASAGLVFEGLQAYAGQLSHNPDFKERQDGVRRKIEKVQGIVDVLRSHGLSVNQISGGGTGTYNITGDDTLWTEIQAGSYVFMDTYYNELELIFENSLTVLTTVIHKRPGAAVTDGGMKACTLENGSPMIKNYPHIKPFKRLSEEHGLFADEKDELAFKQKVEYIPSHCCTTVNLYNRYHCIRNGFLEKTWPIAGRGRSQ